MQEVDIYSPKYCQDWQEKSLYDLAIWKNGLAFKDINFSNKGKPVIKIAELKNGITAQTKFTKDIFEDAVHITKGDMVFSWSGNPQTSIDVFYYDLEDGWLNQHIFKITTKKEVLKNYFFYTLKYLKPNFKMIAANKQTTGLGHVTINDLKKIKIKLPPLAEQKRIASILSSFDDKIELNNKTNKILEEMAQTIFEEWFINFNFPNANGKPYKKSGGEMIGSELGGIPKGWKILTLKDIVNIVKGKKPTATNDKITKKFTMPYLTIDCYNNEKSEYTEYNEKMHVKELDIVMVMDGNAGRIFYGKEGILSSTMAKFVIEDENLNEIVFNFLKSIEYDLMYHTVGSVIQHADKQYILNKKFCVPENNLKRLSDIFEEIRRKVALNKKENQKLSGIRDSLLPKLMAGEIRIDKNFETINF